MRLLIDAAYKGSPGIIHLQRELALSSIVSEALSLSWMVALRLLAAALMAQVGLGKSPVASMGQRNP